MQSEQRALLCAEYALNRKALDVKILHVSELSSLTDYLLLATGTSDRQVQAIAESIRLGLKQNFDLQPLAVEGMNDGRWVLLDYGDVMVHVFQQDVRTFYDLDGLWAEAKELELPAELTVGN
ncbi:MAG: ribosome silencing factor [Desulfuromonas sp.]|nr:ribosome silencing factor [Desulfuromonas sp.]